MKLYNVKVMFPKLVTPDDYKGKKAWKVNIYPKADQLDDLRNAKVRIRTDKEGVEYIVGQRNCISKKGEKVSPPEVVDMFKRTFVGQVGNGSICNVIGSVIDLSKNEDYKGDMFYLQKVQVVKLVEGDEDFDDPVTDEIEEDAL